jgi:hypothetical protein
MCRCSNGSLSLKQWSTPQMSQPYKIMGTTKASKSFSRTNNSLVNKVYSSTAKNSKWLNTVKDWVNRLVFGHLNFHSQFQESGH